MKTRRRVPTIYVIVLLLIGAASAQNCGEQQFLEIPPVVDPNQVATDPVTGDLCLAHFKRVVAGTTVTLVCTACDDDGDAMIVWREDTGEQLSVDATTGTFVLTFRSSDARVVCISVGCTDGTAQRKATYAVEFYVNRAPVLGVAAMPSPVALMKQKLLMAWYQATGNELSSGVRMIEQ